MRLRSVVSDRPKPMALVHDRPFLDWVVDHALSQGFRRMIFATGHQGEWIARHYEGRRDFTAVIAHEDEPRGTAGALRTCRPLIETETVVIMNGDSLCQLDVQALLAAHAERAARVTVAVIPATDRTDGGGLTTNSQGQVVSFQEKGPGPLMNAGVYAMQASLIDTMPNRVPCSLERDVFPSLCSAGLYAFVTDAPVYDIGTPARLAEFQAMVYRAADRQPSPVL